MVYCPGDEKRIVETCNKVLLNIAFSLQSERFLNFCSNVQPFLHLMKRKSAFFAPFVISLHTHTSGIVEQGVLLIFTQGQQQGAALG